MLPCKPAARSAAVKVQTGGCCRIAHSADRPGREEPKRRDKCGRSRSDVWLNAPSSFSGAVPFPRFRNNLQLFQRFWFFGHIFWLPYSWFYKKENKKAVALRRRKKAFLVWKKKSLSQTREKAEKDRKFNESEKELKKNKNAMHEIIFNKNSI